MLVRKAGSRWREEEEEEEEEEGETKENDVGTDEEEVVGGREVNMGENKSGKSCSMSCII